MFNKLNVRVGDRVICDFHRINKKYIGVVKEDRHVLLPDGRLLVFDVSACISGMGMLPPEMHCGLVEIIPRYEMEALQTELIDLMQDRAKSMSRDQMIAFINLLRGNGNSQVVKEK